MARVAFGTRVRRRQNRKWLGFGLLLATTALVMAPRVEAAGEVTRPEHPSYGKVWSIPALSADGTIWAGDVDTDGKIIVYRPDGYIDMGGLGEVLPTFMRSMARALWLLALRAAKITTTAPSAGPRRAEYRAWDCSSHPVTPAAMRMTCRATARVLSGATNNWV